MRDLTSKDAKGDEGSLRATAKAMNDDQAGRLAREIFSVFIEARGLAEG